jgi:hypothetical protein
MKSSREKWLTPPVWRHEVFFENRQARHPYHDLDKLTQRDFLRLSNDLLTLGISTDCQCLSILRTKFLDPMVDINTECWKHGTLQASSWHVKAFCSFASFSHVTRKVRQLLNQRHVIMFLRLWQSIRLVNKYSLPFTETSGSLQFSQKPTTET